MGSNNLRNTIGVLKDQTSITLAKGTSFSNLRVAIVKATSHKACSAKEHHIQEILTLMALSRYHVASCVANISQRLSKTKDWVVAIKTLILIRRLMQEGSLAFTQEVFFTTNYDDTHILDMSNFRDAAWSNSWHFSAFVRAYALYLREQLDSQMWEWEGRYDIFLYTEDEDQHLSSGTLVVGTTPVHEMHNMQIYSRTQHLMKQLDSFLACRPTGAAQNNRMVTLALYPLVNQSFHLYYEITKTVSILLDRFEELDVQDSLNVFEIFCKVSKQYEELNTFYYWCNNACIATTVDSPEINKISQTKLDELNELIIQKVEIKRHDLINEPELQLELELKPEPEPEPEMTPNLTIVKSFPISERFNEEKKETKAEDIGDLLCIEHDAPTTQQHSDQLALALFGNGLVVEPASATTKTQPWEDFESSDWELALVQTPSQLSKQQPFLPCGFDTLLLDGMYKQGAAQAAVSLGMMAIGSASSVASGPSGMSAPLALSQVPLANGVSPGEDPFVASNAVPPPSYVQMSDIEKKKRLLMEEQMMWKQYQGQVGMGDMYMNQSVNNMVGYTYQY